LGEKIMTVIVRSARGASAYTWADDCPTRPLDQSGLLVSDWCLPPTRTWQQLIDDLLAIRSLPDDWDGQGAEAPQPALVDGAITLAQDFKTSGEAPADRVIAGVNGTVFFEWHRPTDYLEIEVTAPDKAEGRLVRKGTDVAVVFTLTRCS
jgi:hypothetical protein